MRINLCTCMENDGFVLCLVRQILNGKELKYCFIFQRLNGFLFI